MIRTAHRLIMLLLCMVVAQGQCVALGCDGIGMADNHKAQNENAAIGHTSDDLPQWEDFGMENVLVVGGQPTVTAPVSVRQAHENESPFGRSFDALHRFQYSSSERSVLPHRANPGYIYHLLCLRL